jgi:23S rRNA pseudouridine1911/1915/1917 synthase
LNSSEPYLREIVHQSKISAELAGKRLDQALVILFSDYSRNRLQGWVREGRVMVNQQPVHRQRDKVTEGDLIELRAVLDGQVACQPQDIPLDIVYEDGYLLVINKPANLVVHPAAGHPDGTLQNALLYHQENLIELPRAGIVHRLDKDTTGLMVVAKTQKSYQKLVAALAAREVKREYRALVVGKLNVGNTVDQPIGRHPKQRVKMAVNPRGKPAVTRYRILEKFPHHTLLKVNLETGRTHQIRVHMAYVRHPVFGDPLYGGRLQLPAGASTELAELMRKFRRQALHAKRLGLAHPVTGKSMQWDAPIPDDLLLLLDALRGQTEIDDFVFDEAFYAACEPEGYVIDEDDDD